MVIKYGKKSKLAFLDGINMASQFIKPSIGPYGSNYLYQDLVITNNGYQILKDLTVDNPLSQLGVNFLTKAADKIYTKFADGTKTFILITAQMLETAQRALNNGVDVLRLTQAINEIRPKIIEVLNRESLPLSEEMLPQLATTTTNDQTIGNLVSNAYFTYGLANYTIETGEELSYYYDNSLQINNGALSIQMLGSTVRRTIDNPRVLIVCGRYDLTRLLETNPQVIIFNNIDENEASTISRHIINCPNGIVAINVSNEELESIRKLADFSLNNGNLVANLKQIEVTENTTTFVSNDFGRLIFRAPNNLVIERLEAAIAAVLYGNTGVSLGTGIPFLHLLDNLESLTNDQVLMAIFEDSLKVPYCQILENGFITNIEVGRPYDFYSQRFVSEEEFRVYQPTSLIIAIINQALDILSNYIFIRGFII